MAKATIFDRDEYYKQFKEILRAEFDNLERLFKMDSLSSKLPKSIKSVSPKTINKLNGLTVEECCDVLLESTFEQEFDNRLSVLQENVFIHQTRNINENMKSFICGGDRAGENEKYYDEADAFSIDDEDKSINLAQCKGAHNTNNKSANEKMVAGLKKSKRQIKMEYPGYRISLTVAVFNDNMNYSYNLKKNGINYWPALKTWEYLSGNGEIAYVTYLRFLTEYRKRILDYIMHQAELVKEYLENSGCIVVGRIDSVLLKLYNEKSKIPDAKYIKMVAYDIRNTHGDDVKKVLHNPKIEKFDKDTDELEEKLRRDVMIADIFDDVDDSLDDQKELIEERRAILNE